MTRRKRVSLCADSRSIAETDTHDKFRGLVSICPDSQTPTTFGELTCFIEDKFRGPVSDCADSQARLAFIYQGTYLIVCVYVGIILVRAYKVILRERKRERQTHIQLLDSWCLCR